MVIGKIHSYLAREEMKFSQFPVMKKRLALISRNQIRSLQRENQVFYVGSESYTGNSAVLYCWYMDYVAAIAAIELVWRVEPTGGFEGA
jgi:hypothetical protein